MVLKGISINDFLSREPIKNKVSGFSGSAWLNKFEYAFAFFSLFVYSEAVFMLFITGGANEGDGFDFGSANYTPIKLCYLINYLLTLIFLICRYKRTIYVALSNPLFVAISIYINLSVLWSYTPAETFQGVIALSFTTLFGFYMACRFTLKEQITILSYVLLTTVILSFVFAIALPKYGVMAGVHGGAWRGVFLHKNQTGKLMALACSVMLIMLNQVRKYSVKRTWMYLIGLFLAFLLIIQTTSGGGLLNSVFIMAIVLITRVFRAEPRKLFLSLIIISVAAVFVSVGYSKIMSFTLGLVGKDPTLTGRTDIWEYIYTKIGQEPAFGYGFQGFWHGFAGESRYIIQRVGWEVPDAHHGFLDMTLQIGIIGSSMVCLSLWQTLLRGIARVRLFKSWVGSWPAVYMLFTVLVNLSETSLLASNSILWVLLVMTIFTTSFEAKCLLDIDRFSLTEKSEFLRSKIINERS
ncbi:MAG: O-antigen ligase [Cyanobacteria bacterium P01_B01_bin.77]